MKAPIGAPSFPRLRRHFAQDMVNRYGRVNEDRNLIHYDAAAARRAGFARPVVHGALVTALLSEACRDYFGREWLDSGRLKVAFIKPVLVDQAVSTGGRVVDGEPREAGRRATLEVWVENEAGERVVAGEASTIPAEAQRRKARDSVQASRAKSTASFFRCAGTAASYGYLMKCPVLNSTTDSSRRTHPSASSFRSAERVAPPSGAGQTPSSRANTF